MAKLNLLVIRGNREKEKEKKGLWILEESFCAVELFMYFLPKIDLDGSGRLTIQFDEEPYDGKMYFCDKYFKISIFYIKPTIMEKINRDNYSNKDEYYLDLIEYVLLYIAEENGKLDELGPIIKEAAQNVRDINYKKIIKLSKLSKTSADKKIKATTYREISSIGEIDYIIINTKGEADRCFDIITKPTTLPLTNKINKCEWEENCFKLYDKEDLMFAVDINQGIIKNRLESH